jgi:hypothetical protein
VDLSHAVGNPDNRYMRFKEAGTSPRRQVLETDAAVVFMSEAAAGSAHRFPFWHGRVGDGITMTIDIRIGEVSAPTGSRKGRLSASLFFYVAGLFQGPRSNLAAGGSVPKAVADYPYSNLTPDPTSADRCSWCLVRKPDPNEDVNAIFQSTGYGKVWNKTKVMHISCKLIGVKYAKNHPEPEYVLGQQCPYLVPVVVVPVESSDDEPDAAIDDPMEACDWSEDDA